MDEIDKYKIILNNCKSSYCIEYVHHLDKDKFLETISKLNLDIEIILTVKDGFKILLNNKVKTKLDKYFKTIYLGKYCGCCIIKEGLSLDYENKHEYYIEFK
jgi:hypothetical protein